MTENAKSRQWSMTANSIFGVLSWFSPIILGFVATPILVTGLGLEAYGLYAVIIGFLSYSFTFGIGRAASKYTAEFNASNEPGKLSQALTAVLLFSFVVGALGATVMAILTPWLVSSILLLPESQRATAEAGLYLACLTGLMLMISQVFQNTLQGMHRFGTYLMFSNFGAVILSAGNIALALSGYGIPALLAWNLFSVLTTGILFFVVAVQAVPDFRPTLKIEIDIIGPVIKYGVSIILYQVFANLFFIFERTWIVRHFGTEALTFYFVPMLLGIYLHGFVTSFALVLFPRINELLSDRDRLIALYRKANRYVFATIAVISVSLIVSGKEFLSLWIGADLAARSYAVLVIHIITFSLIASIVIVWNVAEAFRATSINIAVTLIWLLIGASLMTLMGEASGIEGIASARLAATLLTMPVILYVEKRFLGSVQSGYWSGLFIRVAIASSVLAGIQIASSHWLGLGWIQFIATIGVSGLAFLLMLFITGFFEENEISRFRSSFDRSA